MKLSRIVQLVLLLVVFAVGVACCNSNSTSTPDDTTSGEGYVPPSP